MDKQEIRWIYNQLLLGALICLVLIIACSLGEVLESMY